MLARSRRGSTKTMERALGRMVERLKGPSSRRKEGIRIGSLSRALLLTLNTENMIRFASNLAHKEIGLVYAAHPNIWLNCIKRSMGRRSL
jgi:hypothetical protein